MRPGGPRKLCEPSHESGRVMPKIEVAQFTFEGTAAECVTFAIGAKCTTTGRARAAKAITNPIRSGKGCGGQTCQSPNATSYTANVQGKDEALGAPNKNCVYFRIQDAMKDQTTFDDNTYDSAESGEKDSANDESNHEDGAGIDPSPSFGEPFCQAQKKKGKGVGNKSRVDVAEDAKSNNQEAPIKINDDFGKGAGPIAGQTYDKSTRLFGSSYGHLQSDEPTTPKGVRQKTVSTPDKVTQKHGRPPDIARTTRGREEREAQEIPSSEVPVLGNGRSDEPSTPLCARQEFSSTPVKVAQKHGRPPDLAIRANDSSDDKSNHESKAKLAEAVVSASGNAEHRGTTKAGTIPQSEQYGSDGPLPVFKRTISPCTPRCKGIEVASTPEKGHKRHGRPPDETCRLHERHGRPPGFSPRLADNLP